MLHSLVEEYHPRWGARTSNPVKFVRTGLVGSTPASSAIFPIKLTSSVSYLFSTPNDRAKNPLFATFGDTF